MSTRQEKVSSLLQQEIASYLLNEGIEEQIAGLLTVTGVDVSPDLEHAKVFFSVVGQNEIVVLKILNAAVYQIQGALNRKLKMKKIPRIVFVPDQSGEYAQRIGKLISKLHQDD